MLPALSLDTIALVRHQFALIRPVAPVFAALFCARLFVIATGLRGLFPADTGALERKLIATLALVVAHLDQVPTLAPVPNDLGRRHAGCWIWPRS